MKDIAIYGAGGFGREVACLIARINTAAAAPRWRFVGFFDDGQPKGTMISHYGPVLGGVAELNSWATPLDMALAIGSPDVLQRVHDSLDNPCVEFPNLIDVNFSLLDSATTRLGVGNIIQGPGSLSCDMILGNFNMLVGGVVVGHDAVIGSFNVLMPGARVSGKAVLGDCNLLGANSIVLQQLTIGNKVTLAPGSALMTNPYDGNVYLGVPAKKIYGTQ